MGDVVLVVGRAMLGTGRARVPNPPTLLAWRFKEPSIGLDRSDL